MYIARSDLYNIYNMRYVTICIYIILISKIVTDHFRLYLQDHFVFRIQFQAIGCWYVLDDIHRALNRRIKDYFLKIKLFVRCCLMSSQSHSNEANELGQNNEAHFCIYRPEEYGTRRLNS